MLEGLEKRQQKRSCIVRTRRDELSDSDKAILDEALTSGEYTAYQLHVALADKGLKIAADSIRRHMKGICSC